MSAANSIVIYKPIPGIPGYRVGDDGSVWSCLKAHYISNVPRGKNLQFHMSDDWKQLKTTPGKRGRRRLQLGTHGKHFVHQRVLLAFVGPCPEGMECCHNDGNAANNKLDNLRWDTHSNNQLDAVRQGTHVNNKGEKNGMAKISDSDAQALQADHKTGNYSLKELAKKYRMSVSSVCRLAHKQKSS